MNFLPSPLSASTIGVSAADTTRPDKQFIWRWGRTPDRLTNADEQVLQRIASRSGGEYFRATIPAAQILASPRGTLVRFRDRTGTIANGITSFTMGGGGSNRVTIRAQRLNLAGASAGAFTATLEVGAAPFIASGVLRAAGTGFRFP